MNPGTFKSKSSVVRFNVPEIDSDKDKKKRADSDEETETSIQVIPESHNEKKWVGSYEETKTNIVSVESLTKQRTAKAKKKSKPPKQFSINPFQCYAPTESLINLMEKAKTGIIHKELRVFTMNEVVLHNTENDCWVVIYGVIRDITPLFKKYKGTEEEYLLRPLLAHAGKDISHWFNKNTKDILHFIHPITGVNVPYTPHGRIPDVGLQVPSTEWKALPFYPWWSDSQYIVGLLTKDTRPIKILNMITGKIVMLHVCSEDTIYRIEEKYLQFNSHSCSYTWKYDTRRLDMNMTLDENNIKDERKLFTEYGITDDAYIPVLMVYFNDDLTPS